MTRNHEHITEVELLELYRNTGDKQWIGAVLVRYTTVLLGVCQKYLKDIDLAEDMVQQIILKVLDRPYQDKYENFGGWLYTITRNACLTQLSKTTFTASTDDIDIMGETIDIKALIAKEQQFEQLNKAISMLNEDQKKCIILFFFEEKSYQEIALELNMDIKHVKSHIQNGKRNIKIKMNL